MKQHQEDQRLTAYVLGELPSEEVAAFERALAADPALRADLADMNVFQQGLLDALGGEKELLLPRQRESIRSAAREAARQGKIETLSSHRQARRTWLAPLAAAAVIIGGIFLITLFPKMNGKGGTKLVSGNNDPVISNVLEMPSEQGNVIRLPLKASGKSLSQIMDAVRGEKRIPTIEEVRIPEILNAFPLKPRGAVAPWDGCKLGAEILPSPWKPTSSLVVVEIQGAKDGIRQLSVEYRPQKEAVIAHRLVGYSMVGAAGTADSVSKMQANASMLLVIEIESRDLQLGSLHWSVGGKDAPSIPLVRASDREPSDDARFAALVCAFGLWLREEGGGMIDETVVTRLAREVATDSLVADRSDFLSLIDEVVNLPKK